MKVQTKNKYYLNLNYKESLSITEAALKAKLSIEDFLKTAVFEKLFLDIVKIDAEKKLSALKKEK